MYVPKAYKYMYLTLTTYYYINISHSIPIPSNPHTPTSKYSQQFYQ